MKNYSNQKILDDKYLNKKYDRLTKSYKIIRTRRISNLNGDFSIENKLKDFKDRIRYQFLSHYAARPPIWRLLIRQLNQNRSLPEFAIVGPIKSGTSDLIIHLLLHPNIIEPFAKEIFSENPLDWKVFYPTDKQRYKLNSKNGPSITGFLGPFMHSVRIIDKYSNYCPNAKIVLLLRDPVARAFSHWKWDLFLGGQRVDGLEYFKSFSKYVDMAIELFPDLEMDSVSGFGLLETGIYYKAVERWLKRFGKDNILVVNVADYFNDRNTVLARIQDFLDIPIISLNIKKPILNSNPLKLPPMEEKTRAKLEKFYKPYNEKLYKLIEHDFNW